MPSLKKRVSARISVKRIIRHKMGLKMPRGYGFVTNPKRFAYNKIYNKTSFGFDRLFRNNGKQKASVVDTGNSISGTVLLSILAIILLIVFWPIGLGLIIYLIVKKSNKNDSASGIQGNSAASNNESAVAEINISQLPANINIPEPTKSLLWVTNEDVSKIESAGTVKITVEIGGDGINVVNSKDNPNFFAEPSLIWTRLGIEKNDELEERPMYYPSYSSLSPRHRFQYLSWLKDIAQPTSLSYVFLYFYGLERHLLIGNYDLAADEMLRLIKFHDKGSFKSYAVHSLIAGSVFRKRPDIIEKAPFLLDDVSDLALALKILKQQSLSAKNVIDLAPRIGFNNRRHIKLHPDLFERVLQSKINDFEESNGLIWSQFNQSSFAKDKIMVFANLSIPDRIRTIEFPQILENTKFKSILISLLQKTHDEIKSKKKENIKKLK